MNYTELNSIDELHQLLEQSTSELNPYGFPQIISKLLEKVEDSTIKRQLQDEVVFWGYTLSEGKTNTNTTIQESKVVTTSAREAFSQETSEYLSQRCNESQNIFLKIRYNQILWSGKSNFKSAKNAEICIDAYLKILEKSSYYKRDYINLYENACSLSVEIKYKTDDLKRIVNESLFKGNGCPNYRKIEILKLMIEYPKLFKKEDFSNILELCKSINEFYRKDNNILLANETCAIAGKIALKLSQSDREWNEETGKNYESFANYRMDDETKMIPLESLKNAQQFYQKAKNNVKAEEMGVRYDTLKKELKLSEVQIPLDEKLAKDLYDYNRIRVEKLLAMESS